MGKQNIRKISWKRKSDKESISWVKTEYSKNSSKWNNNDKKVYLGWKFRNSESTSWVKKLNIRKNSWKCKEESKSWVKTKYKQEFQKYILGKKYGKNSWKWKGEKENTSWVKNRYKQELLKMG